MFFKRKRQTLENVQTRCIKEAINLVESIADSTIRILFSIKDVDGLNIEEQEKINIRGNLINKAVNDTLQLSDKMKELSKTANTIR